MSSYKKFSTSNFVKKNPSLVSSYKKFSTSNFVKKNQSLVSSYKKFSTRKFCKQQFVLGEFLQVVFHQQILWRIVEERKKQENTYCNSSSFHQCGWHSIHIDTVELDAGGRQAHRHRHHHHHHQQQQQQQMQQRSRSGRQRPELLTAGGIRLQASLVWASGRCICDTKQPSCSSQSQTHHQTTKNHPPRSIPQKSDKDSHRTKIPISVQVSSWALKSTKIHKERKETKPFYDDGSTRIQKLIKLLLISNGYHLYNRGFLCTSSPKRLNPQRQSNSPPGPPGPPQTSQTPQTPTLTSLLLQAKRIAPTTTTTTDPRLLKTDATTLILHKTGNGTEFVQFAATNFINYRNIVGRNSSSKLEH